MSDPLHVSPAVDVSVPGGVRQYSRMTWRHWLRRQGWKRRLATMGTDVFIEHDVMFLRHPERVSLGDHVIVKEGARICPTHALASISIGDWTTVGHHTFMFASASIAIGSHCLIAPFCYLIDANHGIARHALIREQPLTASRIHIEDDVWLGLGVAVLKGVHIGRGAVVAAHAVVTSDVPDYAIVGGTPARVIGHRE